MSRKPKKSLAETLTLRSAYETYLQPEHAARTVEAYADTLTHWERAPLTTCRPDGTRAKARKDPPLIGCDNTTLLEWRNAITTLVRSPNTVRKHLRQAAAIFARLGPPDRYHRDALGILPRVPYVKPPKEVLRRPTVPSGDELGRLYRAASAATWPRCEVPAGHWWRSVIAVVFNVGLRRLDFLWLPWQAVDLGQATITFDAEKTGKESTWPLHQAAVEHLAAIRAPQRPLVWPVRRGQAEPLPINNWKAAFYRTWHAIREGAGLERRIVPHDLRRACGSGLFALSPAAACEVLQHSSVVTTERSYADVSPETRRLLLEREQPAAFAAAAPRRPEPDPELPPGAVIRFPFAG